MIKEHLKLKTEAITDDTELRFEYLPDEQALSQLSFYFTADEEGVYTKGQLHIDACYAGTEEPVASASYDLADYVLGHFTGEERKKMDEAADRAADAIRLIFTKDVDAAMNQFNQKK